MVVHIQLLAHPASYYTLYATNKHYYIILSTTFSKLPVSINEKMPFLRDLLLPLLLLLLPLLLYALVKCYHRAKKMANLIPSFFRFSLIEFEISFPTQLRENRKLFGFFSSSLFPCCFGKTKCYPMWFQTRKDSIEEQSQSSQQGMKGREKIQNK